MYLQVHSYHTVLAIEEQTETSTEPTFVNAHYVLNTLWYFKRTKCVFNSGNQSKCYYS